jgi:hypothetical protein
MFFIITIPVVWGAWFFITLVFDKYGCSDIGKLSH